MSNLDDNRDYVILAEYNGQASPVKCDANGQIIIEFIVSGSTGADKPVAIDDNRTYPSQVENPSNLSQVLVADSNGYLILDTTGLIVS